MSPYSGGSKTVRYISGHGSRSRIWLQSKFAMKVEGLADSIWKGCAPSFGNSTKRNQGGTGFGLPIARRMVRAHGGDISIESTPGKGTAVKLTIPLQQSEGEEE